MVDDEPPQTRERDSELSPGEPEQARSFSELRDYVPAEIRNVSFPVSIRGYDRRAVDAYVNRVNRLIAELEVSASPRSAVRHALEKAGQQVSGLLERARETADEIIASARQEAEESTARAKAEAAELVVNASSEADETLARSRAEADERLQRLQVELAELREKAGAQLRKLHDETETVWEGRQELLGDVHGLATGLAELASAAAARFPPPEAAEAEEEIPELETRPEAEQPRVPTGQHARTMPAGRSDHGGGDEAPDEELK